jgi:hypothetical protein
MKQKHQIDLKVDGRVLRTVDVDAETILMLMADAAPAAKPKATRNGHRKAVPDDLAEKVLALIPTEPTPLSKVRGLGELGSLPQIRAVVTVLEKQKKIKRTGKARGTMYARN